MPGQESRNRLINNRYQLLNVLGTGAMGEVYLVKDFLNPEKPIALKVIKQELVTPDTVRTFKQEFDIMSRLRHPNLVRVYDFGFDQITGDYYMTMQALNGKSLDTHIASGTIFSGDETCGIMIACCRALAFSHARKILHRDINPKNIVLTDEAVHSNRVKLMDFGLADLLGEAWYRGIQTKPKGTIAYIAGEVLQGRAYTQTDIFALGMTFFELLTGSFYYENHSAQEIIFLLRDPVQFEEYKAKRLNAVPNEGLKRVLEKMTVFAPEDRYASCMEIIRDINTARGTTIDFESDQTKYAYILGAGFVGRRQEFEALKKHLEGQDHAYNALWIIGEAGVGKSRLFFEFKKYCQLHTIAFSEGSCREHQYLSPFLPILDDLLLKANEALISRYGPELKKLLRNHHRLCNITPTIIEDPKIRQFMIIKSLVEFMIDCANTGDTPLVVYFNDMHICDETTITALSVLVKKVTPADNLKLFFSSRREGIAKLEKSIPVDSTKRMKLLPFDEITVKGYIDAIFGENRIGPVLENSIPRINNRVGGNPFYLQELIKSLVETNNLTCHEAFWELPHHLPEINIPTHLEDLIISRLDRLNLTAAQKRILEVMAFLNREISYHELNGIIPLDYDFITFLKDFEIVKSDMGESHIIYKLAHDLITDTISSRVKDRAGLHNFIAERLENNNNENIEPYLEEIADHYYRAKNKAKAKVYLAKAGEQAVKNYENNKIIDLYDKLIALLDTDEDSAQKINLMLEISDVYERTDRRKECIALNNEIITLARKIDDKNSEAKALLGLHYVMDEKTDPGYNDKQTLQKAYDLFELVGNKRGMSRILFSFGFYYRMTDYQKALDYYNEALDLAKQAGAKLVQGSVLCNASYLYIRMGDFQTAIDYATRGLQCFIELGHKRNISIAYVSLGTSSKLIKDYDKALDYFNQAYKIALQIEFTGTIIDSLSYTIEILLLCNRIPEAQTRYETVQTYITENTYYEDKALVYLMGAKLLSARGNKTEAEKILLTVITEHGSDMIDNTELYYVLWKITGKETYRIHSLNILKQKIKQAPNVIFKQMITEMEQTGKSPQTGRHPKTFYS